MLIFGCTTISFAKEWINEEKMIKVDIAVFNDFRKDEFRERFQKRMVFTVNFIEKSGDFEKEEPIFFDENSDNVLLKNAALYSDNQEVDILIKETDFRIIVNVFSIGSTIPIEERKTFRSLYERK